MITLDRTNRKLQAVLAGAITTRQLDVMVRYQDKPRQFNQDLADPQAATLLTNTNSATPVDICAAPPVNGTTRDISHVSIYNDDTVNAVVTVQIDDNGTPYILRQATLTPGQTLVYHFAWWQVV